MDQHANPTPDPAHMDYDEAGVDLEELIPGPAEVKLAWGCVLCKCKTNELLPTTVWREGLAL